MKQSNSLKFKVWIYLIVFSVIILGFLWFFQVVSFKSYYELSTKQRIDTVLVRIMNSYQKENYNEYFDDLAFNNNLCIEIYDDLTRKYSSITCNARTGEFTKLKKQFIENKLNSQGYEFTDQVTDNKNLLYGLKLEDDTYAFIQTSLVPVDSTVQILKGQILIVSIVVCCLSILVAYFISKRISTPIEKISKSAKRLGEGEYGIDFKTDSNINEIKALSNTLNTTSKELAKTENLRRELLSNITHDLKTPLTMIKAYAEMVRDLTYKNKKKREENLNVIIQETDRLNGLVNDVLDLSKYQAGTIKLEYEEFDIDEFIKEVLSRYKIYIDKYGYDISYQGIGSHVVKADRKRLEQVLYNLLNNALNYTGDDKKVFIEVTEDNNKVRVSVRDTGKGIKEKDQKLIWDKYYKADKTYSRMQIGTGIGLSIVKNILELHQFEYGVNSTLGKGTTFYFECN